MTDPLTISVAAVFGVEIVVIVVLVGSMLYLLAETEESWLRRWWNASRHVAWRPPTRAHELLPLARCQLEILREIHASANTIRCAEDYVKSLERSFGGER